MELNYLKGPKITAEIRKGRSMHEDMEGETNVPIILQPKSYADFLYKSLYTSYQAIETLIKNKKARELLLHGNLNGYKLVGKMDELDLVNGKVVIVEDKTKANDNMPSESQMKSHKAQVMLYRKMLSDIMSGAYSKEEFKRANSIQRLFITPELARQLDAMEVKKSLQTLDAITDAFFKGYIGLGELSDTMVIRYINQYTGKTIGTHKFKCTDQEIQEMINFVIKYWNGEREALPVPYEERWKCNYCVFFGKECKVWYPQKKL